MPANATKCRACKPHGSIASSLQSFCQICEQDFACTKHPLAPANILIPICCRLPLARHMTPLPWMRKHYKSTPPTRHTSMSQSLVTTMYISTVRRWSLLIYSSLSRNISVSRTNYDFIPVCPQYELPMMNRNRKYSRDCGWPRRP